MKAEDALHGSASNVSDVAHTSAVMLMVLARRSGKIWEISICKTRKKTHDVGANTHEGSLSRRVGSILRDDRERMIGILMLLRQLQQMAVTTMMMLVADQVRAGSGGGGSRMWWYSLAAHAHACGTTQGRRRWPRYTGVHWRGGSCSRYSPLIIKQREVEPWQAR